MLDLPRLLETVDLAEVVVRAGGTLAAKGSQWRGPCPLHDGNNASAFVIYNGSNGRQRWHCHADCNAGGDAVDFVRRWQTLPDTPEGFWAAVSTLADLTGVPLDGFLEEGVEHHSLRSDPDSNLLTLAADYYQARLQATVGEAARRYAHRRGWQQETVDRYLGFSDGRLRRHLRQRGIDLHDAEAAGLLRKNGRGRLVDAIPADYLIYLHRGLSGQIVYLSGRAINGDDPARKARNLAAPKALFHVEGAADQPLVIVEGQADALSVGEWGHRAVALCGSQLRARDIAQLRQESPCYLALDADATERLTTLASQLGPLTMLVPPPPGHKDLNAWHQAAATAEAFQRLLDDAEPLIERQLREAVALPLWARTNALDALRDSVAVLPDLLRSAYLTHICDGLQLADRAAFTHAVARQRPVTRPDIVADNEGISFDGRHISNFSARIVAQSVEHDGERMLQIEGRLADDGLPSVKVSVTDFLTAAWWLRHWGACAHVVLASSDYWQLAYAIQVLST